MNREKLRELLVEKYDYRNSQVDSVLDRIEAFAPPVAEAFAQWAETGELIGPEIEGMTPLDIASRQPKLKPPAVYLILQWLLDEPEAAKQELNRAHFRNTKTGTS